MTTKKTTTPAKAAPTPAAAVTTVDVTDETLLATRARALTFLAGVSHSEGVRLALGARGYGSPDHDEGWRLLHAATGYQAPSAVGAPTTPTEQSEAQRALDAWDDVNFPIAAAATVHRHPKAHQALFAGDLQAGSGAESVLRVATFLERLDQLDKSDPPAAKTLADRGITREVRERLRAQVKAAQTLRPSDADAASRDASAQAKKLADRAEALRDLRAWYEEWSVIAKAVVRRKDWLIALGLASRKAPRRAKPPTP